MSNEHRICFKKDFDDFIDKFILTNNNTISSNAKRYGYFDILEKYIDTYQYEGNSTLEKLYLYKNQIEIPKCIVCGTLLTFKKWTKPYNKYCSASCATKDRHEKMSSESKQTMYDKSKQTKKERYGDENYVNSKKANKTKLERYGYTSPFYLEYIQNQIKQTNLKKYGTERQLSRKEIHAKSKQTKKERYGDEKYSNKDKMIKTTTEKYGAVGFASNVIKEKISNTNLKKYNNKNYSNFVKSKTTRKENQFNSLNLKYKNVKPLFEINDYDSIHYSNKYKWKCLICDTEFEDDIYAGRSPRCPSCFPYKKSIGEQEIINYLKSLNIKNIIENNRDIINPYELDIYLPEYNLAIEYNGLYWHSIEFIVDEYYHQKKVALAHKQDIRLLHVWENDWKDDRDKIINTINYYLLNEDSIKPKNPELFEINGYKIWK